MQKSALPLKNKAARALFRQSTAPHQSPALELTTASPKNKLTVIGTATLFRRKEVTMHSDSRRQGKKTWEELAAAASKETDPEKVAMIAEEIFAALEERERTCLTRTENP